MFCIKCSNELQEGAQFCPKCGQKVVVLPSYKEMGQQPVPRENPENKGHKVLKGIGIAMAAFLVCFIAFVAWGISLAHNQQVTSEKTDVRPGQNVPVSESGNEPAAPDASNTQPYGTGTTILVYFVGSDLETNGGMATADMDEMMSAGFGDDIHLIIQTGGADKWQNSEIDGTAADAAHIQRYRVRSGKKELVQNLEQSSMASWETLSDFLKWGVDTYPAERYIAILWNHGGGTLGGYGKDEVYNSMLSLGDIQKAFQDTGYHFDAVGFDACLMATFETAYALKDSADYLIASEEVEWGYGWYYTNWLTMLGSAPDNL